MRIPSHFPQPSTSQQVGVVNGSHLPATPHQELKRSDLREKDARRQTGPSETAQ
jgi:hypothetical protein